MPFKAGRGSTITILLNGDSEPVELNQFRHNHSENDEGTEVTSVSHDGIQAFIATILRGQASASFHINSDNLPWASGLKAQAAGEMLIQYGGTYTFTFPFYISSVDYQNEQAGGCDYTVTFKLSGEGGDGIYGYPEEV